MNTAKVQNQLGLRFVAPALTLRDMIEVRPVCMGRRGTPMHGATRCVAETTLAMVCMLGWVPVASYLPHGDSMDQSNLFMGVTHSPRLAPE